MLSFYRIQRGGKQIEYILISERPLTKEHLESDMLFILELSKEVYVWVGKDASFELKANALITGQGFVKQ